MAHRLNSAGLPVADESFSTSSGRAEAPPDRLNFRLEVEGTAEILKQREALAEESRELSARRELQGNARLSGIDEDLARLRKAQNALSEELDTTGKAFREKIRTALAEAIDEDSKLKVRPVERQIDHAKPFRLLLVLCQALGIGLLWWIVRLEKRGSFVREGEIEDSNRASPKRRK